MLRLIITALAMLTMISVTPAEARKLHPRHHASTDCEYTNTGRVICGPAAAVSRRVATRGERVAVAADEGTIIGSRPDGCPRAYCGCGLRKYLGLDDPRLNLARNWARFFPRVSAPAAGMAAVRAGHVMYIEAAAGDGQWLVRDYNSGQGVSRLHVRDVRGYVFVNPRGGGA